MLAVVPAVELRGPQAQHVFGKHVSPAPDGMTALSIIRHRAQKRLGVATIIAVVT